MSKLDVFLFEKMDVYDRLRKAFEVTEEHFWRQLGKTLRVMIKELVGEPFTDTFDTEDFGKREANGYVCRPEWRLDIEEAEEWERSPSFWFPEDPDQMDTLALTGIDGSLDVWAAIWPQPISRYVDDLAWARAAVLCRWGEIGGRMMAPVPWASAASMIVAAERDAERARVALHELLKTAATEFPGIGDPLLVDFGTHRWLSEEHELAYSDWLAWVLDQRGDSGAVLSLFGRVPGTLVGTPCGVHREFSVPEGRLDLVVCCNETAAFAVEVKTTSEPDEEQLERYVQWLNREKQPLGLVLLAISKPESFVPNEWSFQSWRDITLGLRTWAVEWCAQGQLMQAAMTLAFCGAVEQNLLGYSQVGINTPETARYIESWLEQWKNDKDKARH